jgi:hypothetical protein
MSVKLKSPEPAGAPLIGGVANFSSGAMVALAARDGVETLGQDDACGASTLRSSWVKFSAPESGGTDGGLEGRTASPALGELETTALENVGTGVGTIDAA